MQNGQEAVPFYIIGPVVLLFLFTLAALAYWMWRRKELGLEALAKTAGMRYFSEGRASFPMPANSTLRGSKLLKLELGFHDVLTGNHNGVGIALCNLVRYSGSGPEQRPHGYSHLLCSLSFSDLRWPYFLIRPKRRRDMFKSLFRSDLPVFSSPPEFAKKFTVKCERQKDLRTIFTESLRDWCIRHPGIFIEGEDGELLIYRRPSMFKWNAVKAKKFANLPSTGCEFIDKLQE